MPPSVDCPRRPCPSSRGRILHNPVCRVSCSCHQPASSCSRLSLVMEIPCDTLAANLPTSAVLSDYAADHVAVPAEVARPGHPLQPRLRSVLIPSHRPHELPQVLDNAQDLPAQPALVEPTSSSQRQVVSPALCMLLHLLAQALPEVLPRPHVLPDHLPAVPPRQYQVATRPAAQPYLLPAGRLALLPGLALAAAPRLADQHLPHRPAALPRAASAAVPLTAGQPLPRHQVPSQRRQRPAHADAQDPARPLPLPDQVPRAPRLPAYLLPSRPAASLSWTLPARSVLQVVSSAPSARPNPHVSVASTRPHTCSSVSAKRPTQTNTRTSCPHTVAFR